MTKIQIAPSYADVKPQGFYVYIHRRATDGSVFYVGRGIGRRAWQKYTTQRKQHWKNIAAKNGVIVDICQDGMSIDDANTLEMWLIAKFRHEGVDLCNIGDGGEGGNTGSKLSDEARIRIGRCHSKPVNNSSGCRFESLSSAARWLRVNGHPKADTSTLSVAATGKTGSAYGFSWWYDGDEPKEYIDKRKRLSESNLRMIIRSDGEMFRGITNSAESILPKTSSPLGTIKTYISLCLNGKRDSAYGFTWSYA